jgi:hypothetical protein
MSSGRSRLEDSAHGHEEIGGVHVADEHKREIHSNLYLQKGTFANTFCIIAIGNFTMNFFSKKNNFS